MNSRVLLHVDGDEMEVSLVYPQDAGRDNKKLSIFSPIGTAILGYGEGSVIEWEVPSRVLKIHVKKVLYQPDKMPKPATFSMSADFVSAKVFLSLISSPVIFSYRRATKVLNSPLVRG